MKRFTVKEVITDICDDIHPTKIIIKTFFKVFIISGDCTLKPIEWVNSELLDRIVKRTYVGQDNDGHYIKLII